MRDTWHVRASVFEFNYIQMACETLERSVKLFVQYSAILSFNTNFKLESASQ